MIIMSDNNHNSANNPKCTEMREIASKRCSKHTLSEAKIVKT
jgi:hypothetical protein